MNVDHPPQSWMLNTLSIRGLKYHQQSTLLGLLFNPICFAGVFSSRSPLVLDSLHSDWGSFYGLYIVYCIWFARRRGGLGQLQRSDSSLKKERHVKLGDMSLCKN